MFWLSRKPPSSKKAPATPPLLPPLSPPLSPPLLPPLLPPVSPPLPEPPPEAELSLLMVMLSEPSTRSPPSVQPVIARAAETTARQLTCLKSIMNVLLDGLIEPIK
ncbi:MAG: hypothetical protein CMN28_09790 [Salinisphaeraceae bacterium]|nr:hypothetical protein [Salinisphaeraceae bacterium]